MKETPVQTPVRFAHRRGRFLEVLTALEPLRERSAEDLVLLAEAQLVCGRIDAARDTAVAALNTKVLPLSLQSRCTSIVADSYWHTGALDEGRALYQRAMALARDSSDTHQYCRSAAQLLERTCESQSFNSSLPVATLTRQLSAKTGDAQTRAFTHLVFARLEAKAGRFNVARKHFVLGRQCLESDPNDQIAATADIDESCALWLAGELADAIDLARSGFIHASRSGWSQGKVAAAANLACMYVSSGAIEEANKQIEFALNEPFCSPAYRLSLNDTKARAALSAGDATSAIACLAPFDLQTSAFPVWYRLLASETRARAFGRLGRHLEASACLDDAIREATDAGHRSLLASLRLIRLENSLRAGWTIDADKSVLYDVQVAQPLSLIGHVFTTTGMALITRGQLVWGERCLSRAGRLFRNTGDLSATWHGASSRDEVKEAALEGLLPPPAVLDSAVALFELAAHPHILAREAVALIDDMQCASAVALVATGTGPPRIVDARGWSHAEALEAAAAAPDDLVTLGRHRDETWQLIAQPRDALEHRCTLAAIGKVLDAARTLEDHRRDEKQRAALWPAEALDGDPESLWASEQSAELLAIARRIASAPLPVLLTGETGTGKEMLARIIHRASNRADRPMVPLNCAAVPRDMLESQLFGYRKGAFTGADSSFPGVIRGAAGGTLFLDEIGEIGVDLQPKLLRFLEHHEVHPLGDPQPVKVDVRIIAATNRRLEQLVADGRFREDLLYRLNVMQLSLPALRDRREEIPPLVQHYIRRHADEQRKGPLSLGDDTLEYLLLYNWPGNIRQLANEVQRMVALADPGATLTPELLSPEIRATRRTIPASTPAEPDIRLRLNQPLPEAMAELERTLVRHALNRADGRVEDAARLLGISRKGLFLKRRRWRLGQPRT